MNKIIIYITFIILILLAAASFKYGSNEYFSIFITMTVFLSIFLSYFYFEKSSMGTKEIALIATLSTFAAVGRVMFALTPNIKPTTFIVAVSGLVFGPYEGFLIGSNSAFISNIFLGQGPWTPWQMFAWGLVGMISGFIGKKKKAFSAAQFAVVCFIYGFIFDWIMNLWHIIGFVHPLNMRNIALVYLTGITFDIMHAASSFIFSIIFYDNFLRVLKRFKNKMEITYIS